MKQLLILAYLLLNFQTVVGQVLSQNFTGQLTYEIKYTSILVSRDSCGDYIGKRTLVKKTDYFQVWDTFPNEDDNQEYLLTKFIKDDPYLKLVFYNPITKSFDTIDQFPLTKGDTITSNESYLLYVDSFYTWNPSNDELILDEVRIVPDYSRTTNIGDSTITVLGQAYRCYRFEKFHYNRKSNPGPSHFRQIIYIDQVSLLPIQEDSFTWHYSHPCPKVKGWHLANTIQLSKIKNGN